MKLIIIDSSRGKLFDCIDNINIINLNVLIGKQFDKEQIRFILSNIVDKFDNISLCNLASLCFRLGKHYDSMYIVTMLRTIVKIIKYINPDINILYKHIYNYMELGIKPYKDLYTIQDDDVYMVKPLYEIFNTLGYSKLQLVQLISNRKDILKFIPPDLFNKIPTKYNVYRHYTDRYFTKENLDKISLN